MEIAYSSFKVVNNEYLFLYRIRRKLSIEEINLNMYRFNHSSQERKDNLNLMALEQFRTTTLQTRDTPRKLLKDCRKGLLLKDYGFNLMMKKHSENVEREVKRILLTL